MLDTVSIPPLSSLPVWLVDSQGICYNLPYVEPNGRTIGDPVSRRQTGMFHHYDSRKQENFAILLNPMENSRAESRLKDMRVEDNSRSPLDLHRLILSSYIPNWRPYIESLAEQLSSLVGACFISIITANSPNRGIKCLSSTSRAIIQY